MKLSFSTLSSSSSWLSSPSPSSLLLFVTVGIWTFLVKCPGVQTRALASLGDELGELGNVNEAHMKDFEAFPAELQSKLPQQFPQSISEFLQSQGADVGEYGNFYEGDLLLPLPELTPAGLIAEQSLWADNIVKYKFADDVSPKHRTRIRESLQEIAEKTCVDFEEMLSGKRKKSKKKKKKKKKKGQKGDKSTSGGSSSSSSGSASSSKKESGHNHSSKKDGKKKKKKKDPPKEESTDPPPPNLDLTIPTPVDYVYVTTKNKGCYTNVGRLGGRQEMNLNARGCLAKGTIMHEFIHTLGFRHEQSRPDRDSYITINFNNIPEKFKGNFARSQINAMQVLRNPYDYDSILHYGPFSFAKDKAEPTITTKIPGMKIGQRLYLSALDIRKINEQYKCPEDDDDEDEYEEAEDEDEDEDDTKIISK